MALFGRTPIPLYAAALLLGTLLVYQLYAPKGERTDIELYPDDVQMVADGKTLYADHCASCHGAGLEGENNWRERKASGRLPAPRRTSGKPRSRPLAGEGALSSSRIPAAAGPGPNPNPVPGGASRGRRR